FTRTWVPFTEEPLGSVRHRPLSFSTYSPLDLCVQVWALWPLQVQITSLAPLPPWLTSSRHLPRTDSAPPEKVQFWAGVPLQVQMSTLVPLAVPEPKSSRHLPWTPLIAPVIAALIVQLNATDRCAPVTSLAVMVGVYTATVVGVPVMAPVDALMFRPAGSPMALQVSGLPAAELPWTGRLTLTPTGLVWAPGLPIETESWMAPVATHPIAPLLNDALLHSDSTAKVPVESVSLKAPPGLPAGIPAHLSPISLAPVGSNQPLPSGLVIVSAYSAPPTMLHPSLFPPGAGLTKSLAHLFGPASGR